MVYWRGGDLVLVVSGNISSAYKRGLGVLFGTLCLFRPYFLNHM